MRIVTVVGARPQFIKAAVVSRAIRSGSGVHETLVHTGQHYDENMSRVFFGELDIPEPDLNLEIGSGPHGAQTGAMLAALERCFEDEAPDAVLVYGDTNSTLAGALAAAKLHIPVGHVEAGLRSFNRRMPEEVNRVLTDHISSWLFVPTQTAVDNLSAEGLEASRILRVGDVMYDAALYYGERAADRSRIRETEQLDEGQYILATVHRAENTDDLRRLTAVVDGLSEAGRQGTVILPLHPRTRAALVDADLLERLARRVRIIEPVGYLDMAELERAAALVVTDSGGVQKEAYFHGVPCVTLRDETEWVELVENGWNRIVPPTTAEAVTAGIASGLSAGPGRDVRLYGEGDAGERIVRALEAVPGDAP